LAGKKKLYELDGLEKKMFQIIPFFLLLLSPAVCGTSSCEYLRQGLALGWHPEAFSILLLHPYGHCTASKVSASIHAAHFPAKQPEEPLSTSSLFSKAFHLEQNALVVVQPLRLAHQVSGEQDLAVLEVEVAQWVLKEKASLKQMLLQLLYQHHT
jgi:hypothetical protein